MNAMTPVPSTPPRTTPAPAKERAIKEQVVLVLQGGGALGAYQAGVYQALMEGGIEPDWVIGTSIGAINGALIAGNEPANRIARLREFWDGVGRKGPLDQLWPSSIFGNSLANLSTIMSGIPGFFAPNPQAIWGPTFPLGIEKASYYSTDPLRQTLGRLVDFDCLDQTPGQALGRRGQRAHERDALLRLAGDAAWPPRMSWRPARCRRPFPRSPSTASPTGMAASTRIRRSRSCSTTCRGAIR